MNVLSLFDGMSCGRIALGRAGIPVTNYYASEVDKYATAVSAANYPDIIRLGDVTKWREWTIDWSSIDLILAGSPCQGFSFAGKRLAFDDPRSALFFTFKDIINAAEDAKGADVKFLLENVRMEAKHLDVISDCLAVDWVNINSSLVSAQNRNRYYWANWAFSTPEDLGIELTDVLEDCPENVTFMSDKFKTRNAKILRDDVSGKAKCLSAMEYVKNGRQGDYINACAVAHNRKEGVHYRKLTPVECERLQTVPDNYTEGVSNTQRYKMLGNGWTVDVIAHILRGLKK